MNIAALILITIAGVSTEQIKLNTYSPAGKRLYNYFPLATDYLEFIVHADKDVAILLCSQNSVVQPYYEIVIDANIGGKPTSVMRKTQDANFLARNNLPQIVPKEYQMFWVAVNRTDESISVGKSNSRPFMYLHDPNFVKLDYFAVGTGDAGVGEWTFNADLIRK